MLFYKLLLTFLGLLSAIPAYSMPPPYTDTYTNSMKVTGNVGVRNEWKGGGWTDGTGVPSAQDQYAAMMRRRQAAERAAAAFFSKVSAEHKTARAAEAGKKTIHAKMDKAQKDEDVAKAPFEKAEAKRRAETIRDIKEHLREFEENAKRRADEKDTGPSLETEAAKAWEADRPRREAEWARQEAEEKTASAVAFAQENEAIVNEVVAQANERLPGVSTQMEQAASDYVREVLQTSQTVAQNAVELAKNGASRNVVQLVSDFALDTANATNEFLAGVASGVYKGFQTPVQVAEAIYNNPTLLTNISTNIMNTITAGPGAVASAVHDAFEKVSGAVYEMEYTIAFGSPQEKGAALGEFGTNVLLGMAGGEASSAAKSAIEGIASKVTEAGASDALGNAVYNGIRTSEALAPEVAAVDATVKKVGDSAGQLGIREASQIKRLGELTKVTGKSAEEVAGALRGSTGKVGQEFEQHLSRAFDNTGSFSASRPMVGSKMREFDGAVGNIWYEAKSGNYWGSNYGGKGFPKFKSDMGERLAIATENGKEYQLISNTPIPQEAKDWLVSRGIKFLEILE